MNDNNELHLFLGRVEGKLDAAIASLGSLVSRQNDADKAIAKVSERVTVLESRAGHSRWLFPILISLGSAVLAAWVQLKGLLH